MRFGKGVRRQRISHEQAEEILRTVDGLAIAQESVTWHEILPFAAQFNRSAYDASYLALAKAQNLSFITGDLRLYNTVHPELPWVTWVGNYQTLSSE
ncbi:MAG: type II toxin-antitoxin system VapC family toxin [Chloroflexi bacterium]|nr:type II toxin-antitoxin system VapC family toxin [Chloroflexota bacterium]